MILQDMYGYVKPVAKLECFELNAGGDSRSRADVSRKFERHDGIHRSLRL